MEFRKWSKTTRLESIVDITEKLDGSNTAIAIEDVTDDKWAFRDANATHDRFILSNFKVYLFRTQSRNQFIWPQADHQGFSTWAHDNADKLFAILGEGYHYGEWVTKANVNKWFLFNRKRWEQEFASRAESLDSLQAVPLLYRGTYYEGLVAETVERLLKQGSSVYPGTPPEGVVVYWHGDQSMKKFHCKGFVK